MATELQIGARRIVAMNPATGEVIRQFECAGAAEVEAALNTARAAQAEWSRTPLKKRLSILRKFEALLNERKEQVARTITSEAGKPYLESLLTEILVVLDATRFL